MSTIPAEHAWFPQARYGMFIHWGPYSQYGRGEQVLFRDKLDQAEYAKMAKQWNPQAFDATEWAKVALEGGFKYAVLTTRHHDGYCLWDSKLTDYTSVKQAAGRDFVHEYVEAFREAGLRIGLYYSLADWRIKAYWNDVAADPKAWDAFRQYVHGQVRELLTDYGQVDEFWFDGAWPHTQEEWQSEKLVTMMRDLQPAILINNRLGVRKKDMNHPKDHSPVEDVGTSRELGDIGTPEHQIVADPNRMWESCQVSTHRLWGHTPGEHWRTVPVLMDMLCEAASKGGNLLLNVGPDATGRIPDAFKERSRAIGRWLETCGEAIYGTQHGDVFDFVIHGYQTRRENTLYLILRFNDGSGEIRLPALKTQLKAATLLQGDLPLKIESSNGVTTITGLPSPAEIEGYPVIRAECDGLIELHPWAKDRLWCGDPKRMLDWTTGDASAGLT